MKQQLQEVENAKKHFPSQATLLLLTLLISSCSNKEEYWTQLPPAERPSFTIVAPDSLTYVRTSFETEFGLVGHPEHFGSGDSEMIDEIISRLVVLDVETKEPAGTIEVLERHPNYIVVNMTFPELERWFFVGIDESARDIKGLTLPKRMEYPGLGFGIRLMSVSSPRLRSVLRCDEYLFLSFSEPVRKVRRLDDDGVLIPVLMVADTQEECAPFNLSDAYTKYDYGVRYFCLGAPDLSLELSLNKDFVGFRKEPLRTHGKLRLTSDNISQLSETCRSWDFDITEEIALRKK